MWEGDHALRKPGNWGQHVPPDVDRMETLQFVIQQKQKAVDDAKRDNPGCRNVSVNNTLLSSALLFCVCCTPGRLRSGACCCSVHGWQACWPPAATTADAATLPNKACKTPCGTMF